MQFACDIGHGPFSHLYEEFLKRANPTAEAKHENWSEKMIDHLVEHQLPKSGLDNLLLKFQDGSTVDLRYKDSEDWKFIKLCINPPKGENPTVCHLIFNKMYFKI